MEYLIGIDIGTGSAKAIAVDLNGLIVSTHQVYYETEVSEVGFNEQDPEQIWLAFKTCLLTVSTELGNSPIAISLSTAMHSLILSAQDGTLLSPLITWADSRGASIAERIKESEIAEGLYSRTGTPIHAMSPLCKIIWFKENEPAIMQQTSKFLSIKEFIWHKLFGDYIVDHSVASSTGYFNILDLEWDLPALQLAGIRKEHLSKLVLTSYMRSGIGVIDQDLRIFEESNFLIGASDGCLANLGSFATESGVAALTIGTSGAVRVVSRTPIINYPAMTFNYILDENNFICGGPVNNGGSALKWLLTNVFQEPELTTLIYEELFESLKDLDAGSERLIFLPYLTGERAPLWNSDSCGTFFGLTQQHSKPQLAKAVLEGVCFALFDVLQAVQQSSGEITQLNISGGFVQSDVWMQILADITGKQLHLVQKEDASAIGAVMLASKILDLGVTFPDSSSRIIRPDLANHERYQKIFPIFKELYHSLSPLMKKLKHLKL